MKKLTIAVAVLALLLAGCSDKRGYGSPRLGTFDTKPQGDLGATTTAAPPPTTAPVEAASGGNPTTTRPAPTTTARPAAQGYRITIQSDQSGPPFEPRVAQVFAGTPVTWTNGDAVARSVEFSDQSYLSGPIPPGGSATFTPKRSGEFNYSDGTRPYAVGTLTVQAR